MDKITQVYTVLLKSTQHRRIWFIRGSIERSYRYTNERWNRLIKALGDRYDTFDGYGAYCAVWEVRK